MAAVVMAPHADALDCADADPNRVTAAVEGNYEYLADPDDPAQHLIYVNHVKSGPSTIVVARVDGVTGEVEPGTLTTIAGNFQGKQAVNGPEFVHPPGSGLGVLYRALDGVHGVFRPTAPKAWNDFSLTIAGQPAGANPPTLPSTYPASYDAGGLALGQKAYMLIEGHCTVRCFASMRSGVPTDAAKVFESQNLYIATSESVVESVKDGSIDAELCTKPNVSNASCGLYEATIDGLGGFTAGSLRLLSSLPTSVGPTGGRVPLAVGRHPATGSVVFFVSGMHESGETVDVYEQRADAAPLALVASVPAPSNDHYRVRDDGKGTMVLNYLVRRGNLAGSYEIPITAANGRLVVGASTQIAGGSSNGSEVEYLPAAGKFAIFYRTSKSPSLITRCFFTP